MASGRVKPKGGVERFRLGRDGRTILADGKDGREYVVSQDHSSDEKQAQRDQERRVRALNDELLKQAREGRRDLG